MSEQSFDASGLVAKAEQVAKQAHAERQSAFRKELDAATAQASAAPGGGAFLSDGPAPTMDSTLPPPPGLVGRIAEYIYQQAPRPVAEVAIVGALGLMAGIVGRNWHIPGSGLNLYVVLVARSAIGKEAMHSGIMKLVRAASAHCPEAGNYVDSNDYVSGPALFKECAQNPCFVNVAGEIGHKFRAMSQDRDASMRSLQKVMLALYDKSGPDGIAGGISYSNQENNVDAMHSVAFSLIGETTPGIFYESVTDAMMQNGFMSRFCVIEYRGDRPSRNRALLNRPPQDLVDRIVPIVRHAGMAAAANVYQEVAFSGPAEALLDRFNDECDAAIIAAGDDESRRQLWNRAHLKALRVSALLAVGDNYIHPLVTEEQASWAIELMHRGNAAFERRILEGDVGEGSDGGREQKVLELCREFLTLSADKMPHWLKGGEQMQQIGIVPRRYLQQRTQRLAAFEKFKLGHTAALNMAIKTATTNGTLMELRKDTLVEQFGFHGQAYRLLNLS
jgi:hypothetical protein